MDDSHVKELLSELKEKIIVNTELKRQLRGTFEQRKNRQRFPKWGFVGVAATIVLLIANFFHVGWGVAKVEAASLQIENQVSFVDIGSGSAIGVTEYKGNVYVPVFGKGLFAYSNSGFQRLTDRNVDYVKIDQNGKRIIGSSGGSIGIFDLQSQAWTDVLKGDNQSVSYEQPSWVDENTILYVKIVYGLGKTPAIDSGIYEMNLKNKETTRLGDGSFPSYVTNKKSILFEKDGDSKPQIIYKELQSGRETIIDQGRFPSVSPDGNYVAYVKSEQTSRTLQPNAVVQENLDNVWISDVDGKSKRAITQNSSYKYIDETVWLKQIQSFDTLHVLGYSGIYSYYNPVWSSNSKNLYLLKNGNTEGSRMSLTRIDFSTVALNAVATVKAYNQAVIRRDQDFARSLLKNSEGFVISSNPHEVSYSVVGSGKEEGREYVDVEEYRAYTANPNYSIATVRYYVLNTEHGYVIDEMKNTGGILVSQAQDGSIQFDNGAGNKTLFTKDDLPKDIVPEENYRIASLAYLEKQNTLLFAMQVLQDKVKGQQASVKIVSYNLGTKKFSLLENITSLNQMQNIGVEDIIISPDGQFAALDVFSDDEHPFTPHLLLYDLKNNSSILLGQQFPQKEAEGLHTYYWEGDQLHFTLSSNGQNMHYEWDAIKKAIEIP